MVSGSDFYISSEDIYKMLDVEPLSGSFDNGLRLGSTDEAIGNDRNQNPVKPQTSWSLSLFRKRESNNFTVCGGSLQNLPRV